MSTLSSHSSSSPMGVRPKLAALVVGVAVALLLAEGIARLAEWRAHARIEDDSSGRLPNEARPEPRATRGDFRILVVGDSFTDGGGLFEGEPYSHRLAALLTERFGSDAFEVLTFANSGLNTETELRLAYPPIVKLKPDLVLLGICLNDPEPTARYQQHKLLRKAGWYQADSLRTLALYRISAAFRLVIEGYYASRSRRCLRRYYSSLYEKKLPSWRAFKRSLRGFREVSKENGAALVLVVFPIFDSPFDDRYPYRDLHAQLGSLAGELEVPLLDLLPAYEGMDTRDLAVVPFTDPHPNALAHRIAAERILEYLSAEGFLMRAETPAL